ncbi:MAG: AAC(3) family N-acetyltransferase [Thermoplasmatales archaeon]|nr:AAC(3) family N-acetyltransferase [Thermoplasmatales archaeon]
MEDCICNVIQWTTMIYTKEDIIRSLHELGLRKGDVCVARAALREIGNVHSKRSAIVLDALLDTVGKDGTIVALTFTNAYRLPLNPHNPKYVFTKDTPTYAGGFSKECLSRPDAIRSRHPVTSFCAIGKDAHFILDGHDEKSSCYEPIGRVIEKKGKLLLIGAMDTSPGFTTVHWAQWLLGFATKSIDKNKTGAYYYDKDGQKKLYIREDIGGCSRGFYNFHNHYRKAGILSEGYIGDAPCMLIEGEKALAIEMALIKSDPCFPLCNYPACRMCRIGWEFCDTSRLVFWLNPKSLLFMMLKGLMKIIGGLKNDDMLQR